MPTFHYQAWNAEQQPVTGKLDAETVQQAIAQLEGDGLTLQSIGYAPVESTLPTVQLLATDADSAHRVIEQTILRTHLTKILEGGQAIILALEAFGEELPAGGRRNELHELIAILKRGDATEAENAFAELPDYWIPLLSAAISSSDPGRILQRFIHESRRADELRRQWWLALSYPLLIACAAVAVFVLLSVLVIPSFRDIFLGFNLNLPVMTSLTLALASSVARAWPYVLVVLVLLFAGLALRSWRGPTRSFGVSTSRLAFFGRTTAVARISHFMADLLEAGLSVPDTLKVAGFLTNRKSLRKSVWRLAEHMQINAIAATQLQPPPKMTSVYHALRTDIPTPSRVRLLREIAQVYADQVQSRLSWTRGLVEPVAIIVIGSVVAWVVISLFLPLVKLIEGLSN